MSFFSVQESQKKEASQTQRRHERKKEKRKKSARLQLQAQEQILEQSQTQAGTTGQTEDTHVQPQLTETAPPQTEKPQKTVVKTEPKTPKASARPSILCSRFDRSTFLKTLLPRFHLGSEGPPSVSDPRDGLLQGVCDRRSGVVQSGHLPVVALHGLL